MRMKLRRRNFVYETQNEVYCGFSFTKTINWCRGTNRVARNIHTRSCTLEHRNSNRAYISPCLSICRCVTEYQLIVLEIHTRTYNTRTYIYRTKLPLSNHSIEPPSCFWLSFSYYGSLRSLQITLVNVGVCPTSTDL